MTPSIGLDEAWTDNAHSTARDHKADFITSVNPGLAVSGKGARMELGLDYNGAYDHYAAEDDLSGWRHHGLAMAKAEPLEDLFFVDLRGALTEQNVTSTGAATAGERTSATNTQRVGTWAVTPSLRQRFGPWAAGSVSYRHDQTSYMSTGTGTSAATGTTPDSTGDSGKLQLRNGEAFNRLLWETSLETAHVERSNSVFAQTTGTVRGEYRLDQAFGLLAHGGGDQINDTTLDSDRVSGAFFGGGLHWTPGADTDVKAELGRRYGAIDVAALASHRLAPHTTLKLGHTTGVTTESQAFADALDTVQRDETGRFIDPFSGLAADPLATRFSLTSSAYRQRATTLAVTHERSRDRVTLSGDVIRRQSLGGTPVDITDVWLAAIWTHRLTETFSATTRLEGSRVIRGSAGEEGSRRVRALLDLGYAFNTTTTGRAGYRYVDTQPEQSAGITENMVTLGLRKTF